MSTHAKKKCKEAWGRRKKKTGKMIDYSLQNPNYIVQ
jgi:hypothetical protein